MDMSLSGLLNFLDAHAAWAGPVLCLVSFSSALFLIGVFVPVTASLLAAGSAVALEQWHPTIAIWAMIGITVGTIVSYELGRCLPAGSKAAITKRAPRAFAVAEKAIGRYGASSIVLTRFTGPPATLPFIAGYLGLARDRFLASAVIAALWVPVVMSIGYAATVGVLHIS